MAEFYTQNGWQGSEHEKVKSVKEVAKLLREFIKGDALLSSCKWSVLSDYNRISVTLLAAPFNPFNHELEREKISEDTRHYYYYNRSREYSNKCNEAFQKIQNFLLSYNRDDSDAQIDYFDRFFYESYEIGKWDRPFQKVEKNKSVEIKTTEDFKILDYSEKAIVLVGDTKKIKENLKELGGRFNMHLKCGAGWVFSKKRQSDLENLLKIV